MNQARISLLRTVLFAAAGLLNLAAHAHAQGIYVGPGGISFGTRVGSYYLPFNNGGAFSNRGGYYGPSDYDGTRGYPARAYGRSGFFWAPGMYWSPSNYWYGDRGWPRFNSALTNPNRSVFSDGSRRYRDEFENRATLPPLPQFEELDRMNWTHLRRVLAFGANQLEQGLDRVATGSKWGGYLGVDRLRAIAADQANVPPTREEADEVQALLKKFDQTADNDQYSGISGLWGFEAVRRTLAEFLQNPAVRYRQQLVRNSTDLGRALDRFGTGATWQQYLSLPTDLFVGPGDAAVTKNPPDPDALRKALAKFDDVAKNPAYRMIGNLPAFEATRASLARYLGRELPEDNPVVESAQTPNPPMDLAEGTLGEIKVAPQADQLQPEPKPSVSATKEAAPKGDRKPKAPVKQVEELFPPEGAAPRQVGPAVREKE